MISKGATAFPSPDLREREREGEIRCEGSGAFAFLFNLFPYLLIRFQLYSLFYFTWRNEKTGGKGGNDMGREKSTVLDSPEKK